MREINHFTVMYISPVADFSRAYKSLKVLVDSRTMPTLVFRP